MKREAFLKLMNKVKIYDLTMPLSVHTPPWPSYMPLQIQYFKRTAGCYGGGMGANGQIILTITAFPLAMLVVLSLSPLC